MANYLLNLFRPITERQIKPEPSSKSVAGSGVARGWSPDSSAVATGVEAVDVKLEVVAGSSEDEGQPTIPKNKITTHKTINNFFTLSSP